MIELLFFISLISLIYASGFFSGSEIAFFSLPSTKVKAYQSSPNPRKQLIANLLKHPRDLLVTIFLMNTLVNILLQNVFSSLFGIEASWIFKVGVPLIVTLILGEVIPKNIAMQNNVRLATAVAPTINFFTYHLRHVRKWLVSITTPISRIMFFFLKREPPISTEELQHVLHTSKEFGVLHHEEAELIDGYLQLHNAQAKELMRPRQDVLFYNIHDPLSKLQHLFVEEEVSRLPICDDTLDQVLGILSAQEYFLHQNEIQSSKDLLSFLKKPYYLPETMPAWLLLRRLKEKNEILALIVDEHRSISGLLTREDLVEVIIGPITDRRDSSSLYTQDSKNTVIADGSLELSTLEELFGIPFESPNNMVTIGGWLTEEIGEIPKSASTYETDDFLFKVLSAEPTHIKKVYIRKKRRLKI